METLVKSELPIWKQELLAECERAICELPDPPSIDLPDLQEDAPDLIGFHTELAMLRNEQRTGNRKLFEVLEDFSGVLNDVKSSQSKSKETPTATAGDQKTVGKVARQLIDLLDRLDRIIDASLTPLEVETGLLQLINRRPTPAQWQRQSESLDMLRQHFSPIMELIGLEYRSVVGDAYDPETMKAIDCPPGLDFDEMLVTKEMVKGYWCDGENIRIAEVVLGTAGSREID